jgi:hypothetical protein
MFNRTVINKGDTHTYVTEKVTEKRAPTDESVRLLREMESKAKEEVIKSISLPSNEFSGVVHLMRDYLSCKTKVVVLFKLNGKDHKVPISLDDFKDDNLEKRMRKVLNDVSDYLAANILQKVFDAQQMKELYKSI